MAEALFRLPQLSALKGGVIVNILQIVTCFNE
jgi:hypothetical protein